MSWEAPLQSIVESIGGPVAKIVGVIIVIVTGLTLAFGDTMGGFRRLEIHPAAVGRYIDASPISRENLSAPPPSRRVAASTSSSKTFSAPCLERPKCRVLMR